MADRKTCMTFSLGDEVITKLKTLAESNGRSYTSEVAMLINKAYKSSASDVEIRNYPVDNSDVPF